MLAHTLIGGLLALAIALPLAWKWGLGVLRAALFVTPAAIACGALVALLASAVELALAVRAAIVFLLTLSLAGATVAYRFYRDPERTPPEGDDVVVSPADGEVVYVRESRGGMLPVSSKHGRQYTLEELTKTPLASDDAIVIGIGLSFLDVHVNRAPIAGRVAVQRRFSGSFGSLRLPEMVFENERATVVIERDDLQVAVVQIASRLVRRIRSFVSEGEHVALGQRIGVIHFGSQVDLVLPLRDGLRVTVEPGQRLRAAESVVAVLERVPAPTAGAASEVPS